MKFPLRLTADLTLGLAIRFLRFDPAGSLFVNLPGGGRVDQASSPIVWIGGNEPLELAETPGIVNSLAAAKRHVFLPTRGILLRRRIHEFQPSPRLHLTLCFDGAEAAHDRRAGCQGAFRDALESVRAARLSGFLLCAQLILHVPDEAVELDCLHGELRKLDFDGFLISFARSDSSQVNQELQRAASGLRRRLLTRRWALLSTLLDPVWPATAAVSPPDIAPQRRLHETAAQLRPQAYEESVQAP
jgi:hypothetical protein